MAKTTNSNGAGKGDSYRHVDPIKWARGWLRCYGIKCIKCNKDGKELNINKNCSNCAGIGYIEQRK